LPLTQTAELVNSIAGALTSTGKGLALYLPRNFLQPLSHLTVVQLSQEIILGREVSRKIFFTFTTSVERKDTTG